jgi:hypothetical protein
VKDDYGFGICLSFFKDEDEVRVFMMGVGMFAFKDELVHVGYHPYDSTVALYGLMFPTREC